MSKSVEARPEGNRAVAAFRFAAPFVLALSPVLLAACGASTPVKEGTPQPATRSQLARDLIRERRYEGPVATANARLNATSTASRGNVLVNAILADPKVGTAFAGDLEKSVQTAATQGRLVLTATPDPTATPSRASTIDGALRTNREYQDAIDAAYSTVVAPGQKAVNDQILGNATVRAIGSRVAGAAVAEAKRDGRLADDSTATRPAGSSTPSVAPTASRPATPPATVTRAGTPGVVASVSPSPDGRTPVGTGIVTITLTPSPAGISTPKVVATIRR